MKCLLALAVLLGTPATSVQRPLEHLGVAPPKTVRKMALRLYLDADVDGLGEEFLRSDEANTEENDPFGDSIDVPIRDALRQFLPGMVERVNLIYEKASQELTITLDKKAWIKIPTASGQAEEAKLFEPNNATKPVALIPLNEFPYQSPKSKMWMMGVREVAALLGGSTDFQNYQVNVITNDGWRKVAGLRPSKAPPILEYAPEFGISPFVGNQVMIWAKLRRAAYVQIYTMQGKFGDLQPVLGVNSRGQRRNLLGGSLSDQVPASWKMPAGEQLHLNALIKDVGEETVDLVRYILVVTERDPGSKDPLEVLKCEGETSLGKCFVIGVSQQVADCPLYYASRSKRSDEKTVKDIAKNLSMDPQMFAVLNGLEVSDKLQQDVSYVYIDYSRLPNYSPEEPGKSSLLYAVQENESLGNIAKKWNTTEAQLMKENGLENNDVFPGMLLNYSYQSGSPAPSSNTEPPVLLDANGTIKARTSVYEAASASAAAIPGSTLSVGSKVRVLGRVTNDTTRYLHISATIKDRIVDGFVLHSSVSLPQSAPALQTPSLGNDAASRLISFALRFYGTPYKWGGNDLRRGIDCSHFVNSVFIKTGLSCPSPPVINQELFGDIVHFGSSFRGTMKMGSVAIKPNPALQDPSLLRRGDRLIFQYPPKGKNGSNRHTAVFAGAIKFRGRQYRYGFVHSNGSNGVSIDDLATKYRSIYAYAVRGTAKRRSR